MKRYKIPAYDETTGRGLIRHVYVRTNRRGESLCCVVANGRKVPREAELAALVLAAAPKTLGVVLNINTKRGNVILGDQYRTLWGQDFLMDSLCGLTFRLSVPSFYQVNRDQAEVLYEKALEFAALTGSETVLDLYCGAGTITLCLAGRAKRVIGAEIVPAAIRDAEENAERNGIKNAEFFCGDAADTAAMLEAQGLRPDVITVDPPRKGLAPEVIAAAAAMGPERIVYVSCDPGTGRAAVRGTGLPGRPGGSGGHVPRDKTCRDGCPTFQGRNRLAEGQGGVLAGGYGYVRVPEGRNLWADQRICAGEVWAEGVQPVYLPGQAEMWAGGWAEL